MRRSSKPSRQHLGLQRMQRQLALSLRPGPLQSGVLPLPDAAHSAHWHAQQSCAWRAHSAWWHELPTNAIPTMILQLSLLVLLERSPSGRPLLRMPSCIAGVARTAGCCHITLAMICLPAAPPVPQQQISGVQAGRCPRPGQAVRAAGGGPGLSSRSDCSCCWGQPCRGKAGGGAGGPHSGGLHVTSCKSLLVRTWSHAAPQCLLALVCLLHLTASEASLKGFNHMRLSAFRHAASQCLLRILQAGFVRSTSHQPIAQTVPQGTHTGCSSALGLQPGR